MRTGGAECGDQQVAVGVEQWRERSFELYLSPPGHLKPCMTKIDLHTLCAHGRLYPRAPVLSHPMFHAPVPPAPLSHDGVLQTAHRRGSALPAHMRRYVRPVSTQSVIQKPCMTEIFLHFRCAHYRLSGNAPVHVPWTASTTG